MDRYKFQIFTPGRAIMGELESRKFRKILSAIIVCILLLGTVVTFSFTTPLVYGDTSNNISDESNFQLISNPRTGSDSNNWTMFLGNTQNHGYSDNIIPKINTTVWTYKFKDKFGDPIPIFSSPVVYDDQVFIGVNNHIFYSFDKLTGEINWNQPLDDLVIQGAYPIESTPTVHDDKLYFGSDDKHFYCLNTSDGSMNWYYPTSGVIRSSAKIANNTVVFGTYGNPSKARIYALNATTGVQVWNFIAPGEGNFHSTPAIDDEIVYVGYEPDNPSSGLSTIYALNLNNGTLLWNATTSNGVISAISVVNDKVLFGDLDGTIYGLDKGNGSINWTKATGGEIYSSPAVDVANNVMYIGSNDGNFYALDFNDGSEYWQYPVQSAINSPPLIANDKVVFGATDEHYYCLKATTASMIPPLRLIWEFNTNGLAESACAVVEGMIFTAAGNGQVIAFANPDLAAAIGEMRVSENAPYIGEEIEISGKVFNNGSLELSGTVNFYFHISFTFGQGPPEKILISKHNVKLDVGEEIIINTATIIPYRDWSVVTNTFILLEIDNVSYDESKISNNIDIETLEVLNYYEDDWISFQRDNLNSGLGDSGSETNKSIWQFDLSTTSGGSGSIVNSPLVGKGRVFVGSTNGWLYSILDSGPKLDWEFNARSKISGSPAILMNDAGKKTYEKIVVGTEDGKVYALNINQGELNWTYEITGNTIKATPLIFEGVVYLGTTTGEFYAFDEDGLHDGDQGTIDLNTSNLAGDVLWQTTLASGIQSAPVVFNDTLVLAISGAGGHSLLGLSAKNGNIKWSYDFDGAIPGSPIIDSTKEYVFIGVNDNNVYAFDLDGTTNGNQGVTNEDAAKNNKADIIWRYKHGATLLTTGAQDMENNRLVFGTENGWIYTINSNNGNLIWSFKGNGKFIAPPTIGNNYVYAGSDNGILYCLKEFRDNVSTTNTTLVWQFLTGSSIQAPAVSDNFATYVATTDGKIYKLGAPNLPPKAIIVKPELNQTYFSDDIITLDASDSFDLEDGFNLTYQWNFKKQGVVGKFLELQARTKSAIVNVPLNTTIMKGGDYIINLTVFDSYNTMAYNTTNITIFDPVIRLYKNESIPASCKILFSGSGGVDLYMVNDPNFDSGGSVGNIGKFVDVVYITHNPLYRVRWYNVTIGYTTQDLPEGYNVKRVRMFEYNKETDSWEKSANTGINLATREVWANLSGDQLKPSVRYLFAPGTFDNSPPTIELVQTGVTPFNGTKDETYEYLIEYFDSDSDLPISANEGYITIEINGKPYDLIETSVNDTDPSDGKYYTLSLVGDDLRPENTFSINAHDGTYLVRTKLYSGPNVTFGQPPMADAGPDINAKAGKTFFLDASGSSDPDGIIEKFLWDTDNDGIFDDTDGSREGQKVSMRFDDPGTYIVTLKVIDDDDNFGTDTLTVTVTEDDDGTSTTDAEDMLWLYLGLIIIIIIVILIVAMLLYRRQLEDKRDKQVFMGGGAVDLGEDEDMADEEAEEPVDEDEPDEDEADLDDVEEDEFAEDLADDELEDSDIEDLDEDLNEEEPDVEELEDLEEDVEESPKKPVKKKTTAKSKPKKIAKKSKVVKKKK
jgi:outer membrane protein assembly factor BamB